MARHRKTSAFEDLIFIASRLPWWLSLLLALLSWYLLHGYAISTPPRLTDPSQFSSHLTAAAFRGWATAFQYIIPAACVFGAITSLYAKVSDVNRYNPLWGTLQGKYSGSFQINTTQAEQLHNCITA